MRTLFLIILALLAFAANSLLCRLALGHELIDPASFTSVRLISGAITLFILLKLKTHQTNLERDLVSSGFLFLYAVCFSFAYLLLNTGTGALILFGTVQITMVTCSLLQGEKPAATTWFGLVSALAGLVYLVAPGVTSPPLKGAVLMAIAGMAWGFYSLRGQRSTGPIASTTSNFFYSIPLALVISLILSDDIFLSSKGLILAILSGSAASAVGYAIWYTALPKLTPLIAASVQISVPMLATIGGIIFLDELMSLRLGIASLLILAGIALVVLSRRTTVPVQ